MKTLKRITIALTLALAAVVGVGAPVYAATVSPVLSIAVAADAPVFEIPVVPASILVLLNIASPYIVSFFAYFNWPSATKKIVAVVVSFVGSAAVLVVSLIVGWIPQDFTPLGWVTLFVLGLGIQQSFYGLIFKESADAFSKTVGFNKQ